MSKHKYTDDILKICENNHLTWEEIFLKLKEKHPEVWLATVYRSINFLVKNWKLRKITTIKWKVYYETFTKQHFHFINEETGQIIDISPEDIQISEKLLKKIKNINNINIFGNLK